jgi:LacI family transcriptional regulator
MTSLAIQRNGPQPIYEQTKSWLRQQIVSGQFKPESAVPDEDVLAGQFGISPMTVRRALIELTDEGLLKRIRGKGTFVRGSFAPQRRTRRHSVGILSNYLRKAPTDHFYDRIFRSIQLTAEEHGLTMVVRDISEPFETMVSSLAEDSALKAMIVLGVADQPLLRLLERIGKPIVLLDSLQPEGGPEFDEVNYTAEAAVFDAVCSLLRRGHREIGMIRGEHDNPFHLQRQKGYERALAAFGVPYRDELVHRVPLCAEGAYPCMQRIIDSGKIPTAMFCTDDVMASAAMIAALERGIKLPHQLSFVGMGGYSVFTSPRLSSIVLPMDQMGSTAVQLLKERLENPTGSIKRVLLPAEWRPWASCSVAPSNFGGGKP